MAKDTPLNIRKLSIYQVFPFGFSKEGTLQKVITKLPYIKDMGFDYVYLLPLHERGVLNRKGTYGSPYAIKDYYSIDHHIGTMEDFEALIAEAHKLGLKVMMDIVYNHSSPDCVYTLEHPEYYLRDENGNFLRKVDDWDDVIDFDFRNQELREELLNVLKFWALKGVDGYRFDVAAIVPVDFWIKARKMLKEINPNFVMLAESVEGGFIDYNRSRGIEMASDSELFEAMDICYSYDIKEIFDEALKVDGDLKTYSRMLNYQQIAYPLNGFKVYGVENHDRPRIYSIIKDKMMIYNWVAFSFLSKSVSFVYNGQEVFEDGFTNFFEKTEIDWSKEGYSEYLKKLNHLKKDLFKDDEYISQKMVEDADVLMMDIKDNKDHYFGVFNVHGFKGKKKVNLPDGIYKNLIDDKEVAVVDSLIEITAEPLYVRV